MRILSYGLAASLYNKLSDSVWSSIDTCFSEKSLQNTQTYSFAYFCTMCRMGYLFNNTRIRHILLYQNPDASDNISISRDPNVIRTS